MKKGDSLFINFPTQKQYNTPYLIKFLSILLNDSEQKIFNKVINSEHVKDINFVSNGMDLIEIKHYTIKNSVLSFSIYHLSGKGYYSIGAIKKLDSGDIYIGMGSELKYGKTSSMPKIYRSDYEIIIPNKFMIGKIWFQW
jgi:hypothetical protein